jgi:hypothetical protein
MPQCTHESDGSQQSLADIMKYYFDLVEPLEETQKT